MDPTLVLVLCGMALLIISSFAAELYRIGRDIEQERSYPRWINSRSATSSRLLIERTPHG